MTDTFTAIDLLLQLMELPAPTGQEKNRSHFICRLLKTWGYETAYIDEKNNVAIPLIIREKEPVTIFAAHLDTVFSMETDYTVSREEDRLIAPGIGDDTANAALLLAVMKAFKEKKMHPVQNLLFVFDCGEEGLGNLFGIRHIFKHLTLPVKLMFAFDLTYHTISTRSVGSKRFLLTIRTPGGHSYNDFPSPNAIALSATLLTRLYTMDTASLDGQTTFNAGTISGGTSVNTIAQEASFLFEYRSDKESSLAAMHSQFHALLDTFQKEVLPPECTLSIETLGTRPCCKESEKLCFELSDLEKNYAALIKKHTGKTPKSIRLSTDANLPLSLGIPAISFGGYDGGGAHTLKEWIRPSSLACGFALFFDVLSPYYRNV